MGGTRSCGENLPWVEVKGSLAYPSYLGRANFFHILYKTWQTVYFINKTLAQLEALFR